MFVSLRKLSEVSGEVEFYTSFINAPHLLNFYTTLHKLILLPSFGNANWNWNFSLYHRLPGAKLVCQDRVSLVSSADNGFIKNAEILVP